MRPFLLIVGDAQLAPIDMQFHFEPTHNLYLNLASGIGLLGRMLYFAFFAGLIVNSLYDPMHQDALMTLLWTPESVRTGENG